MALLSRINALEGKTDDTQTWASRMLDMLPKREDLVQADQEALRGWIGVYGTRLYGFSSRITTRKRARRGSFHNILNVLEASGIDAPRIRALCYRMLGQVSSHGPSMRDAEEALRLYDLALELSRQHDNLPEVCRGLYDKALLLSGMNDLNLAAVTAAEAAEIARQVSDYGMVSQIQDLSASIYRGGADLVHAAQIAGKALVSGARVKSPLLQGQAYLEEGNRHIFQMDAIKARAAAEKAIDCFLRANAQGRLLKAYEMMSTCAILENDFESARGWYGKMRELAISLGDTITLQRLVMLDAVLEHNKTVAVSRNDSNSA